MALLSTKAWQEHFKASLPAFKFSHSSSRTGSPSYIFSFNDRGMGSDAVQITIPDFEDDNDFTSTPIFGRTAGSLWNAAASGQTSPIVTTPMTERADRNYFHSRGDSVASEDSAHSIQFAARKFKAPFVHSTQSSVATTSSTPFSKKTSFASLRNAFKKSSDPAPPPLPPLDHQPYPVLKNPFNRSTSSLAQHSQGRPSIQGSPTQFRPSTPASGDSRIRGPSRQRGHASAKSQHSHTGSVFHTSDGGSDLGHGSGFVPSLLPPPVPPVPSGFGEQVHSDDEQDDDNVVVEARTPADFALHAIFIRFAASAEALIDDFVNQPLDRDPILSAYMGSGVDAGFDALLQSLGKIAQKHAKSVVESVMRWRKSQTEHGHSEFHPLYPGRTKSRFNDSEGLSTERRSLASIYIMCRALAVITQSLSKDSLSESAGNELEATIFDRLREPDVKLLTISANHRLNAELYAVLLGNLADIRFESVTDRYLVELGPVAAGQVPKDSDFKYEHLVKSLRHVHIKVWPPENFEEGAEFLESLSKSFENAHGFRLKSVFAETLTHLLYGIAKTAQAEVNHPQWAKAIEIIYPRARDMTTKPRYWSVAFPLAVVSLCVAPREYFLRNWIALVESVLNKLKDKPFRVPVLNGILRLIWTYLYRCHESGSTVVTKMETLMKHFFPPNRLTIFPQEEHIELFAYMVHFILSRHFDYGSELCLELLQERNINGQVSNVAANLAPDRMSIALQAVLLSIHLLEKEDQGVPVWPSSPDFSVVSSWEDYPSSSDLLPSDSSLFQNRAGWTEFMERCNSCIKTIAVGCYQSVGRMSILDEQWSATRLNPSYEEAHNYIIRKHPEGDVAYPANLFAATSVLQVCYQSWPRCLHPTLQLENTFDILIRGVLHVEPGINDVASATLLRFTPDFAQSCVLLTRFNFHLFDPQSILGEGAALKLTVECSRLLQLWFSIVEKWVSSVTEHPRVSMTDSEVETVSTLLDSLETGALFLLCHTRRAVFATGMKLVRLLGTLLAHLRDDPVSPAEEEHDRNMRITDFLLNKAIGSTDLQISADCLNDDQLNRFNQWKGSDKSDATLLLIGSERYAERMIWRHILAAFLQSHIEQSPHVFVDFREKLVAAIRRYHPFIVQLSSVNVKLHQSGPSRGFSAGDRDGSKLVTDHIASVDQWQFWGMLLCASAHVSDTRPTAGSISRDHSRARSEANVERDQFDTSRDMFRYFSPFMDSDHTAFRDAAVICISTLPPYAYSYLLEDLSILSSRQIYDEPRGKASTVPLVGRVRRQERFQTAVARIYYMTAHYLQSQRSSAKQTALAHVLKYIRNMQAFLCSPENRNLFTLQRLRRYFCGTLERFFDGLATLNDSDRFIPSGMHLALYRLCEEWCQVGKQPELVTKRLIDMQAAAMRSYQDPSAQAELIQRFQTETKELSNAAVGAMASLIAKAYFPPEISASGSPSDKFGPEQLRPLEAPQILDRLLAMLANYNERIQNCGKKALRALLIHVPYDDIFSDQVLRRAFVTVRGLETSNARFYEVVADVICTTEHGFKFSQVVCLGLSNLWHPVLEIRQRAFNMLESIHEQTSGIIPITQHEAAVTSYAPSVYLYAHRIVSATLAGEHPDYAVDVLAQFSDWIPRVFDNNAEVSQGTSHSASPGGLLILLQSLEHWVPSIDLMASDRTGLSREGRFAIYHLMALTTQYAETHAEQIFVLWTKLVDQPYHSNGQAVVRFLLEQSHKVGSATFIGCAAKVVACLSQSEIGKQLFQEICSIIEPARMLPALEHKLAMPDAEEVELWSDLDVLFSQEPRLQLGAAQFALLFLSECAFQYALEDFRDLEEHLHILLHALFTHLDHRSSFVQHRCRHMLFQLIRSCVSSYDKLPDRTLYPNRSMLKRAILDLEMDFKKTLWKEEDSSSQVEEQMRIFCSRVITLLEPLSPSLTTKLGSLSLKWSTSCAIRPIAFRSLQLFRALEPKFGQGEVANLIGRLSESISGEQQSLQDFSVELITTMTTMASSGELDPSLLPQMFWCAVACLSTTAEREYRCVLDCLGVLLVRLDLDDPHTADLLMSHKPEWQGASSVQAALLTGLRSSTTSAASFKLLQYLTKVADSRIIDDAESRVRDLYTLSLPWCLHAMTIESHDEALQEFALNIGHLADLEERPSITRIMTSFAKGRFRTKDDFLRQSVASLREHYGKEHWAEVVTLLVGLVLNNERWLRVHTLQILKVLFKQRETGRSVDVLGSEVLMPLLRLLETDLASEALEVLDEPLQISGGPAAKHVIRMSLHHHLLTSVQEVESIAEIFGIPQDSGWCVPRSSSRRDMCRTNVQAVFDLCKAPWRPSRLDFQPDEIPFLGDGPAGDNMGDLVRNLHELSSYFREERETNRHFAQVAAILAKSTGSTTDPPQTPLSSVFDIETVSSYEPSDGVSTSDSESDLFEFDSFTRD